MTKVTLEVPEGYMSYMLALTLGDRGAEHEKRAIEWYCKTGVKDETYDYLMSLARQLYGWAVEVSNQTKKEK